MEINTKLLSFTDNVYKLYIDDSYCGIIEEIGGLYSIYINEIFNYGNFEDRLFDSLDEAISTIKNFSN